jgi:hypothetical protein
MALHCETDTEETHTRTCDVEHEPTGFHAATAWVEASAAEECQYCPLCRGPVECFDSGPGTGVRKLFRRGKQGNPCCGTGGDRAAEATDPSHDIRVEHGPFQDVSVRSVESVEDRALFRSNLHSLSQEEVFHPDDDIALSPFLRLPKGLQRCVSAVGMGEMEDLALLVACRV